MGEAIHLEISSEGVFLSLQEVLSQHYKDPGCKSNSLWLAVSCAFSWRYDLQTLSAHKDQWKLSKNLGGPFLPNFPLQHHNQGLSNLVMPEAFYYLSRCYLSGAYFERILVYPSGHEILEATILRQILHKLQCSIYRHNQAQETSKHLVVM
ncbi:Reticulocalbin-2 [Frankliniella fusca]|uniref:Reticulocalbin-2 n=1 Tax=Frankliniella fusca TaxID=407009 RepID=A0AAE1HIQ6_9NEOP|nr:Reticulocalbin-2 [Frankliniella fusca]